MAQIAHLLTAVKTATTEAAAPERAAAPDDGAFAALLAAVVPVMPEPKLPALPKDAPQQDVPPQEIAKAAPQPRPRMPAIAMPRPSAALPPGAKNQTLPQAPAKDQMPPLPSMSAEGVDDDAPVVTAVHAVTPGTVDMPAPPRADDPPRQRTSIRDAARPVTQAARSVVDKIVALAKNAAAEPVVPGTEVVAKPQPAKPQAAALRAPPRVAVLEKTPAAPQTDPVAPPRPKVQTRPDAKPQAAVGKAPPPRVVVLDKTPPSAPEASDSDAPAPHADAQPQAMAPRPDRPAVEQPAPPAVHAAPQPMQPATHAMAANPQVQAPVQAAAPAAAKAPGSAPPPPDVPALAAAIAHKAGQGARLFEIRLDPPELGHVEVHLSVAHDGRAEASLVADRPETVALLARDSHNLERALRDAGLDVSNSSLNFSLKGEQRQGDGGGASKAHTRNLSDSVVARSDAVNASLASQSYAPRDGRLDIRV